METHSFKRISRREFYALGGVGCVRRAEGAHWTYWLIRSQRT
jgi:hypothetical protein